MLPGQRRQAILAAVRAEDATSAEALAWQFSVSVETIRRDLRALHSDGLPERVYGGATRPSGRSSEGSFSAESVRNIERKRAVAALAASLIEPDDTVALLEVRQDGRLRQSSRARLVPGRSIGLDVRWTRDVDGAGGPILVTAHESAIVTHVRA